MIKRMLSVTLVLIMVLSTASLTLFTASAEATEVFSTADESSTDEATQDEAKLVISDEPKVPTYSVNGTVIGYIGDANLDEKINVKDATAIQKYLAKLNVLSERAKTLSDADNNQKLNVRDATAVQKYIAGIEVNSKIWHLIYETGTHKHNYIDTVVEPKCEQNGYTIHGCICGDEQRDSFVPMTGHNYKSSVVKPTCVEEGYTLFTCLSCKHSYKENSTPATGVHNYNSRNICVLCGMEKDPYDILKDYLIDKGYYDENSSSFCVYLDTGYDVDSGVVAYDELDDEISICYALVIEDVVSTVEVIISKDSPYFSSYVAYPGLFNTSSSYTTKSNWTFGSDFLANLDCYYYEEWNEIPEEECMLYSVLFVDTALALYEYHEDSLPVTLYDLGFTSFTAK